MNDFQKFISYIEAIEPSDFENWSKYDFVAIRYIENQTALGINKENYAKLLLFAREKLPKLASSLPEDFLNKKILDFAVKAFNNPKITSLEPLIDEFSSPLLDKYNVVLKLYNFEMETDEFISDEFALLHPNMFYEKYINNI